MGTVLAIGALVGFGAVYFAYATWLTNGIKPRVFKTRVPKTQLRDQFSEKVARAGWKIVDDGNPLIAQSSLITGIRQQIALELSEDGPVTTVRVGPQRWVTKWGVPVKAHTIRLRLDSFVKAVREMDPAVAPQKSELRGR